MAQKTFRFDLSLHFKKPGLHLITDLVSQKLMEALEKSPSSRGMLYIFNPHTSAALTLNEAWDPSANSDLVQFLDHLAPKNLSFVTHTLEGMDDSPAHMKTALLQSHLLLMVEQKKLVLGRWQGIFFAEFKDHPPSRSLFFKFIED